MLNLISELPKQQAASLLHTDGLDHPVDLACNVDIKDDHILVDFTGTSPVSEYGINCPLCYTTAYAAFAVKCVVAPKVPNNTGSLDLIKVTAPVNTIVNAAFPCAVAVRSVIGHLLPDAVFGCLHQILPGRVPAEGAGSLWGLKAGAGVGLTRDAVAGKYTGFMLMSLHSGGAGARPELDGLSATPFPSGVKNVPVEVTEAITPIVVWKKELRQDSGGAGRSRGGLGQTMIIGSREDASFVMFATFDRVQHPPEGREGGLAGASGTLNLASGKPLAAKGRHVIAKGERVVLQMPGGGGYGNPAERSLEAIEGDLTKGLISWEAARRDYRLTRDKDGNLIRKRT